MKDNRAHWKAAKEYGIYPEGNKKMKSLEDRIRERIINREEYLKRTDDTHERIRTREAIKYMRYFLQWLDNYHCIPKEGTVELETIIKFWDVDQIEIPWLQSVMKEAKINTDKRKKLYIREVENEADKRNNTS